MQLALMGLANAGARRSVDANQQIVAAPITATTIQKLLDLLEWRLRPRAACSTMTPSTNSLAVIGISLTSARRAIDMGRQSRDVGSPPAPAMFSVACASSHLTPRRMPTATTTSIRFAATGLGIPAGIRANGTAHASAHHLSIGPTTSRTFAVGPHLRVGPGPSAKCSPNTDGFSPASSGSSSSSHSEWIASAGLQGGFSHTGSRTSGMGVDRISRKCCRNDARRGSSDVSIEASVRGSPSRCKPNPAAPACARSRG